MGENDVIKAAEGLTASEGDRRLGDASSVSASTSTSTSACATATATSVRATLDAWRERGVACADRVRFDRIEALERRAQACRGTARQVIEARIAALLDVQTGMAIAALASAPSVERDEPIPLKPSRDKRAGPLGALAQSIVQGQAEADRAYTEATQLRAAPGHAGPAVASDRGAQILEYFREVWSRISAENQWREFPTHVPENAGPLNTSKLVFRSMDLMRTLSPEYLKQFLTYVDALSWLQQMSGDDAALKKDVIKKDVIKKDAPKKDASKAPAARKTTRKKN